MFFVVSKDKIVSYLVSLCTVMTLLGIAFYMKNDNNQSFEVAANASQDFKIAIVVECSSEEGIDEILNLLKNENIKISFYLNSDIYKFNQDTIKKISSSGNEILYNKTKLNNCITYKDNLLDVNNIKNDLKDNSMILVSNSVLTKDFKNMISYLKDNNISIVTTSEI